MDGLFVRKQCWSVQAGGLRTQHLLDVDARDDPAYAEASSCAPGDSHGSAWAVAMKKFPAVGIEMKLCGVRRPPRSSSHTASRASMARAGRRRPAPLVRPSTRASPVSPFATESLGAARECCVLALQAHALKTRRCPPRCGHTGAPLVVFRCFLAHMSSSGRCRRFSVHLISRRAVSRRPNRSPRVCGATQRGAHLPPRSFCAVTPIALPSVTRSLGN
jgi:hypothetical protein